GCARGTLLLFILSLCWTEKRNFTARQTEEKCVKPRAQLVGGGSFLWESKNRRRERLTVSYSRSGGPGGQHVNKVNTKAEVRFHVRTADWLPEDVRLKILEKNKNRINKAGELLVTSELSRSQQRNLTDCVEKISAIITEASEKPHEPTEEDVALRAARLEKRNKERLKQKKIHSATKQSRKVDFY
uniref:Large ribosomal subunit protein mL62 n=1 Tax=Salarias fasciatus TaxID=181472 RepID=A0A672I1U7_SALFA